jgi:hypothetical protein
MRGKNPQGRFDMNYEKLAIYEGIHEELVQTVGVNISWFRWRNDYLEENFDTIVDDIYDVSSSESGGGRLWMLPFQLPVVMARIVRGGSMINDRGFYAVDSMTLSVSAGDIKKFLPDILKNEPNEFIKDRIIYRGQVFTPTRVLPQGHLGYDWTVVSIDCTEVNAEELVNDPQFQKYATPVKPSLREQD